MLRIASERSATRLGVARRPPGCFRRSTVGDEIGVVGWLGKPGLAPIATGAAMPAGIPAAAPAGTGESGTPIEDARPLKTPTGAVAWP